MICKDCPFGELVQIDSLIWMVKCSIEDTLMAKEDECYFPETIAEKGV